MVFAKVFILALLLPGLALSAEEEAGLLLNGKSALGEKRELGRDHNNNKEKCKMGKKDDMGMDGMGMKRELGFGEGRHHHHETAAPKGMGMKRELGRDNSNNKEMCKMGDEDDMGMDDMGRKRELGFGEGRHHHHETAAPKGMGMKRELDRDHSNNKEKCKMGEGGDMGMDDMGMKRELVKGGVYMTRMALR